MMTCRTLTDRKGKAFAVVCFANVFEFPYNGKAYLIEWHPWCGAVPLRKDGDPRVRIPADFWEAVEAFADLSHAERDQYRVGE